jgi:hypothetical protein
VVRGNQPMTTDKDEALSILNRELSACETWSREELVRQLGHAQVKHVIGPSGTRYNVEREIHWDEKENGNLRITISVDDGGLRTFLPVTRSILVSPRGKIVK